MVLAGLIRLFVSVMVLVVILSRTLLTLHLFHGNDNHNGNFIRLMLRLYNNIITIMMMMMMMMTTMMMMIMS